MSEESVTCPECGTVLLGSGGVCPRCSSPVGEQKERAVLDEQGRSTGISVVPLLKASPNQPAPTPIVLEERGGDDGQGGGFLDMAGDALELDTGAMSARQQAKAGFVTQYEDQGRTGGFLKMKGDQQIDLDEHALAGRRRKPPPPGFAARTHSDSGAPILDGTPPPAPMHVPTPAIPMASPPMQPQPVPMPVQAAQPTQAPPNPFGSVPHSEPMAPVQPYAQPRPATGEVPRPRSRPDVQRAQRASWWPIVAGLTVLAAIGVIAFLFIQRAG